MRILLVTATRSARAEFDQTLIGRTLKTYGSGLPLEAKVFFDNKLGLPKCYNEAVDAAGPDDIVVLAHDDVLITDFFWAAKAVRALEKSEILGIAGNVRRLPKQPSWAFVDDNYTWDESDKLSGVVGNGDGFPCIISRFGPVPSPCLLLDGSLLISRASTLKRIPFDEQFGFHFYDMDLCRQAEAAGISMSTVPINIIHGSVGNFYTPDWHADYGRYLAKWGA